MTVVILLATYNGKRHLRQQITSIFTQSHPHFLLVAKDDCSDDSTYAILQYYKKHYPSKMVLLDRDVRNQGPIRTFSALLEYVLEHERELNLNDYCIAFCDQDDIWHRDKLRISLDYLTLVSSTSKNNRVLIHSDLTVINEQGDTIDASFSHYQGLRPYSNHFVDLIMYNAVTGCTMLITPDLARACVPIPEDAYMHDWWCTLIASLSGCIHYIEQPLVFYRQHQSNTLGARRFVAQSKFITLQGLIAPQADQEIKCVARQARCLLRSTRYRLTWAQTFACCLTGYLMQYKSIVVRALTMKLLRYLSIYSHWRQRAAS